MKKLYSILIALIVLLPNVNFAQGRKLVDGKFVIKLKPSHGKKLLKQSNFQLPLHQNSGLAALDAANTSFNVTNMKRVFKEVPNNEKAHNAYGLNLWYELSYTSNSSVSDVISHYSSLESVELCEGKYEYQLIEPADGSNTTFGDLSNIVGDPNDPEFSTQWHYKNTGQSGGTVGADINLVSAWGIETGSDAVIVAVIDQGIDVNHPDIAQNMWINSDEIAGNNIDDDANGYIDDLYGYSFGDNDGTIYPGYHGTHVGGTIAAVSNNAIGVSGIAGGSGSGDGIRLMSCAAFGEFSQGGFEDAMVYAADNGAVISQNSWRGGTAAIEAAIDYFVARAGYDNTNANFDSNIQIGPMAGGIVIFAAGNDNTDNPSIGYPASYEPNLAVASTDHNDRKSSFSNYGNWVDIAAPGSNVYSTYPTDLGSYAFLSGTSMACPHASGVAALIISKFGGNGYVPEFVWGRLTESTDSIDHLNPGYEGYLGTGRLNAFYALQIEDSVPPTAITDLFVLDTLAEEVTLMWTAPGDTLGAVAYYDIRYSLTLIDDSNFDNATQVFDPPAPVPEGEKQKYLLTGLLPETEYYFAIKSHDYFGYRSEISNVGQATTKILPEMTVLPDSFGVSLFSGDTSSQILSISNSPGVGDLKYQLTVRYDTSIVSNGINLPAFQNSNVHIDGKTIEAITSGPVLTEFADLEGIRIGFFDQYYSSLGSDLSARNATVTYISNFSQIDLDEYDVLVLDDFLAAFSSDEIAALKDWLHAGGSLILQGDNSGTALNENTVLEGTGLTLRPFGAYYEEDFTNFETHPTTENITSLRSTAYGAVFDIDPSKSVSPIVYNYSGEVFVATTKISIGNVFVVGDEIFLEYYDDNRIFANQVIDFMAGFSNNWIKLPSKYGVVHGGQTDEVPVIFDAQGLYGGLYSGSIEVESNDPLNNGVIIPFAIEVTGAPAIEVSKDSVHFGTHFIGSHLIDSIKITNTGTDTLIVSDILLDHVDFQVDTTLLILDPTDDYWLKVQYNPSNVDHHTVDLLIISNDVDKDTSVVNLNGYGVEPPVISVSPDSIGESLFTGESAIHSLTIDNVAGGSDLIVQLESTEFINLPLAIQNKIEQNKESRYDVSSHDENSTSVRPANHRIQIGESSNVLIIKEWDAWGYNSNEELLTELGATISVISSHSIASTELQDFDVVLIESEQSGTFYQNFINNYSKFEEYVVAGGVLQVHTATYSGYRNPNLTLPGGLSIAEYAYSSGVNYLVNSDHEISLDVPEEMHGSSASHEWFINLPDNAETIAENVEGNPTLVLYEYGAGLVIATGMTWEIGWEYDWTSAVPIYANTLAFALSFEPSSWLQLPVADTVVEAGGSVDIEVVFDATGMNGGQYQNAIKITSNDPVNDKIDIPVTLQVTDAPDIYVNRDTVDFGSKFVDSYSADSLLIENIGTDTLHISNIFTDGSDFKVDTTSLTLLPNDEFHLNVTYHPIEVESDNYKLLVVSNDPDEDTLEIALVGIGIEPPVIEVLPDSLHEELYSNDSSVQLLTVDNTSGGSVLNYTISVDNYVSEANAVHENILFNGSLDIPKSKERTNQSKKSEHYTSAFKRTDYGLTASSPGLEIVLEELEIRYNELVELIPNRYDFYDGEYGYSIGDGGYDMYDGGNVFHTNFGGSIQYSNKVITNTTYFNNEAYFTAKYPGLFILSADLSGMSEFRIDGDLGADGAGNVDGSILTINKYGKRFIGFVKRVYNAGDPSVNHLVIVEDNGSVQHEFSTNTNDDYHRIFNLDHIDRIYYLLYTGSQEVDNGYYIDDVTTLNIMDKFVSIAENGNNWLSINEYSGSVPAGTSEDIEVNFNALGLYGGEYFGEVDIISNDPTNPLVSVPVVLNVTSIPQIDVAVDSLNFGNVFVGTSDSIQLTILNIGTDTLSISDIFSDNSAFNPGNTSLKLVPESDITISIVFSPESPGQFEGNLSIVSNDLYHDTTIVHLRGTGIEPPIIRVSPEVLTEQLYSGDSSVQILNIDNSTGGSELIYTIEVDKHASLSNRIIENVDFSPLGEFPLSKMEADEIDSKAYKSIYERDVPDISGNNPDLEYVLSELETNYSGVTSKIPSRYDFYDGVNGYQIYDGGDDMYDGGNQLYTNLGGAIYYSDKQISNSFDFNNSNYFTAKYPGLFVLAADLQGIDQFTISGNLGADGAGTVDGSILSINRFGKKYLGFVKRVYNTSYNPSVNHLIIVEDNGVVQHEFSTYSNDDFHSVQNLNGIDRIYYLLYAGSNGAYIDDNANLSIMSQFISIVERNGNWLSTNTDSGTIPAGQSQDIQVKFNADGLYGGEYNGSINISSNDPFSSLLNVPVTLNVTGMPQLVITPDSLQFNDQFVGTSSIRSLSVSNIGSDTLFISDISSESEEFVTSSTNLVLGPESETSISVEFMPGISGLIEGRLTFKSNDFYQDSLVVSLYGNGIDPPLISADPLSFSDVLLEDDSSTHHLSIQNLDGGSDLEWEIIPKRAAGNGDQAFGYSNSIYLDTLSNFPNYSYGMVEVEGLLYAVQPDYDRIVIYDPSEEEIINYIPVHNRPYGIAYAYDLLWVGNYNGYFRSYDFEGNEYGSFQGPNYDNSSITFTGEYFLIKEIFGYYENIYLVDSVGNLIQNYGNPTNSQFHDMSYVFGDLWALSNQYGDYKILRMNVTEDEILVRDTLELEDNSCFSLSHDGSHLYLGQYYGPLYEVDDNVNYFDWIQFSQHKGTVAAGGSITIEVQLNSEELNPRDYMAWLDIESNDPFADEIELAFDLEVVSNLPPIASDQEFTVDENSPKGMLIGQIVAEDKRDELTYTLQLGKDAFAFDLSMDGDLYVWDSVEFDFEKHRSLACNVKISDGEFDEFIVVTVNINDLAESVNQEPIIVDQSFKIEENSPIGSPIGTLSAFDPDGDSLIFRIAAGNDDGAFLLNSSSGDLSILDSSLFDFESRSTFSLIVEVSDQELTDLAIVSVDIVDVDETIITSIDDNSEHIQLFPNPATSIIYVNANFIITGIRIVDVHGATIKRIIVDRKRSFELDVNDIPDGNYLLIINTTDGEHRTERMIKH